MANILLVEDDDQLRSLLRLLLKVSGHDVQEASDGTQVCNIYQQQHFDLVITDLVMPDIEGLELIRELRRIDQNVRIIAMSGGGRGQGQGEEYLNLAKKLGAQLTLSKPFSNQVFLDGVRQALETDPPKAE